VDFSSIFGRSCRVFELPRSYSATPRTLQSSGARGVEAEARAMNPSTFHTCNPYLRQVSYSFERSFPSAFEGPPTRNVSTAVTQT